MNRLLLIVYTVFLSLISFTYKAQNTEWTVVSSTVSFKIKNAGFTIDGKFGALTATIIFDETKVKTFELKNKDDVAFDIVEELAHILTNT